MYGENQPSMRTWIIHWITALGAVAVLATSFLPLTAIGTRATWMNVHVSLGWSLLALSALRFLLAISPGSVWRHIPPLRRMVAVATLSVLLVCAALGILLFRPSPLGGNTYIFWLFPAPSIHLLGHGSTVWILPLHRFLAYGLVAVLTIHVISAFVPYRRAGSLPIRWLWQGSRQAPGRNSGQVTAASPEVDPE